MPLALPPDGLDPLTSVAALADVSSILEVCLRATGMRYAVVAHVSADRWLACAVQDEVEFGLPVGGELPIKTTLCHEVRERRATIAFDQASASPYWVDHHTPKTYGLESYIAAPIVLSDGTFFGTLCAIDPKPAPASRPDIVRMFELFASLIAAQLDAQARAAASDAALLDARADEQLREQFIAVLGHDLRNPLAAIEAGVILLQKSPTPERAGLLLADMKRSTARMARLINDVLDFARGRLGGGISLNQGAADQLPANLQQVIDELSASHPTRVIDVDLAITRPVAADADRVSQLLSNLLGNALTHGDPNRPVSVRATTADGQFELAVANHGEPIPEALRQRMFRPFERQVQAGEGLGLGLYIASQIAAAHNGTMSLQSDVNQTVFSFRMPLSE